MRTPILNGFKAVMEIVCLSCFITSCIPLPPGGGGNPTPGTFAINISSTYSAMSSSMPNQSRKIIVVDGDSLLFDTYAGGYSLGTSIHYFYIHPHNADANLFQFYCYRDTTPYMYEQGDGNCITYPAGVTITNTWSDSGEWRIPNDIPNTPNTPPFANQFGFFGTSIYGVTGVLGYMPELPENTYRYIIFRRVTQQGNKYFWIRLRYTPAGLLAHTLTIINGRYQMNQIITGQ